MKIWHWDQNNSGGSFITDENLCSSVYIEAETFDEANAKALSFGIYYDGVADGCDCECCGDRWYQPWNEEKDFSEEKVQKWANQYGGWTKPDARIFYADGTVKAIIKT